MNNTKQTMLAQITGTNDNYTGLVLRITMGGILFPHGAQKVFGWFNGPGFSGEMHHLTTVAGLPAFIAVMVILIEFLGALLLLAGLLTRIAALAVGILFVGIIVKVHAGMGFFMNWFGTLPAGVEGFEYHLLVIGICLALLLTGGGKYALDRKCSRLYKHWLTA